MMFGVLVILREIVVIEPCFNANGFVQRLFTTGARQLVDAHDCAVTIGLLTWRCNLRSLTPNDNV